MVVEQHFYAVVVAVGGGVAVVAWLPLGVADKVGVANWRGLAVGE